MSLNKLVHYFLVVTLIGSGFVSLYYRILGVKVFLFDFLGVLFIVIISIYFISLNTIKSSTLKEVSPLIFLILLVFLTDTLSVLGVLSSGHQDSMGQFVKGISHSMFLTVFIIFFLVFNALNDYKYSKSYLKIFIFTMLLSCLYQFTSIFLDLGYDVNLDEIVWPLLSFGSWASNGQDAHIGSAGLTFVRHGGFAVNPNLLVAQLVSVIPITLAVAKSSSIKTYLFIFVIFILSMLATISRSGILSLGVVLVLYPVFFKVHKKNFINALSVSLTLVCLLLVVDWYLGLGVINIIYKLLEIRINSEGYFDSSRFQLVLAGLDMWSNYPLFGVGLNNSQIMLENYEISRSTGVNLHNYWLQIFVEKGIFVFPKIIYYVFIFYSSLRYRNIYGSSLALTLIALGVTGLMNNALASPFIQVLLVVIFCAAVQERRRLLV